MALGYTVAVVLQFANYATYGTGAEGGSGVVAPAWYVAVGLYQREGRSEVVEGFETDENAGRDVATYKVACGGYDVVGDGCAHIDNKAGLVGHNDSGTDSGCNAVGTECGRGAVVDGDWQPCRGGEYDDRGGERCKDVDDFLRIASTHGTDYGRVDTLAFGDERMQHLWRESGVRHN